MITKRKKKVTLTVKCFVKRSFFHKNEQNDQERSHHFEKKNERIQRVLKNIGTICKGTERKLLEKNVWNQERVLIIKNAF